MKTNKIQSAKKQLENIISNCEVVATSGENIILKSNNFLCEFHESLTNKDLLKRAAAVDRACYHDRKINGGLSVQAAIVFIMEHKENAKNIIISSANNAYLDNKRLCEVKFSQSDYNYALDVLRF